MANINPMNLFRSAMTCSVLAIAIAAGSMNAALASGLDATVNTTRLAFGDSFTLRLSNDNGDRSPPDLAPLQQDFNVLGSSQSSQTTIVNGARTDSFAWLITLSPRALGKASIPSLQAGQLSSDPLTIEVLEPTAMPAGHSSDVGLSIDVSLEPGSHYVHEEIPLTVTITKGAGARELQLSEPATGDFSLRQNGEDKVYRSDRNGEVIQVIERKYLLQPQKSGSLTVPPLTLLARVSAPAAQRSPFGGAVGGNPFSSLFNSSGMSAAFFNDISNPGRQVTVSSKPLVLDIKSRPSADGGWFLPAKDVQIHATWDPASPTFKVGETATRTVRLLALGAAQEQLPDIQLDSADGARIYVDRADSKTVDTARGTVAMREFVTSVVPTGSAEISLPEIQVKWWDTEADVERVATLPAETYNVQGGTVAATTAGAITDTVAANANNANARQSGHHAEGLPWLWLSTGGFVLLALSGILWRLMAGAGSRRRGSTSATSPAPGQTAPRRSVTGHEEKIARALKTLASACDRKDRVGAYTACFKWLYLAYGASSLTPSRLEEISPQLARELASMERALYAEDNQAPWSGKSLSIAIASAAASLTAANVRRSRTEILPPLYPAWTSH
jgi:hypothetical protein